RSSLIVGNTFQQAPTAIAMESIAFTAHNVFTDLDHAATNTEGTETSFENNTVVDVRADVLAGDYVLASDNVFHEITSLLGQTREAVITNNLIPEALTEFKSANLLGASPEFLTHRFALAAHSLGQNAGTLGQELGAFGPRGAQVLLHPQGSTAAATIDGATIESVEWRLDEGVVEQLFIDNDDRTTTVTLQNLSEGEHVLEVWGEDDAGVKQIVPTTIRWHASAGNSPIVISEILPRNQTSHPVGDRFPDGVELHNPTEATVNLSGYTLSDTEESKNPFAFPEGTLLMGHGRLIAYGGDPDPNHAELHWLGFSFSEGEPIVLADAKDNILWKVTFGAPLADHSLNRQPNSSCRVALPSLGETNASPIQLGDPLAIVVNEWLIAPSVTFQEDFIELYNPLALPIDLGGFHLTDDPTGRNEGLVFP
ncbi:MAG: lamin tail domain-containing protein, partial [Verrucomicrobiales bacterium]